MLENLIKENVLAIFFEAPDKAPDCPVNRQGRNCSFTTIKFPQTINPYEILQLYINNFFTMKFNQWNELQKTSTVHSFLQTQIAANVEIMSSVIMTVYYVCLINVYKEKIIPE